MTVEERKNMRADEEARAEIIKVHFILIKKNFGIKF